MDHMKKLPIGLKVTLLCTIDEFSSLISIICTCQAMHDAFVVAGTRILSRVMARALPTDVLVEALTVADATRLSKPSDLEVKTLLDGYAQRYNEVPDAATPLFFELSRRHMLIEWFSRDLCSTLASCTSNRQQYKWVGPLSANETLRIHRALYRFELYRLLFGQESFPRAQMEIDLAQDYLLERYTSWELEELGCIYVYLAGRLFPLDGAIQKRLEERMWESYPEYAVACERSDNIPFNSVQEGGLLRGLEFLYQILCTTGREQQEALLLNNGIPAEKARFSNHSTPATRSSSLSLTLSKSPRNLDGWIGPGATYLNALSTWRSENRLLDGLNDLPFAKGTSNEFKNPDDASGPNWAWLWAHDNVHTAAYFDDSKAMLREWLYTIWDKSRLDEWRVTDGEWTENDCHTWLGARVPGIVAKLEQRRLAEEESSTWHLQNAWRERYVLDEYQTPPPPVISQSHNSQRLYFLY